MKKDVKTDRPSRESFLPRELAELAAQRRVFHVPDLAAAKSRYQYAVAAEAVSPSWSMVDAWHIDACGNVDPEMSAPSPVILAEVFELDVSEPAARRNMTSFIKGERFVYLFGLPKDPGRPEEAHFKAMGVGPNLIGAAVDAAKRLREREPEIERAAPDHPLKRLLSSLEDGSAVATFRERGSQPSQQVLGQYMSIETLRVAEVLTSRPEASEMGDRLGDSPTRISELRSAFAGLVRRELAGDSLRPELVSWEEISRSLPGYGQSAIQRRAAPHPVGELFVSEFPEEQPVSGRKIDADVLAVLSRCFTRENQVVLPPERLDPKLYKRVDEVLRALGGKWVGRKIQAHVFEIDPAAVLEVAIQTGSYIKPQDFGYFPTPDDLVARVLDMADIKPGMALLEPSAGRGAFARRMADVVGGQQHVTVCELLSSNAQKLREAGFDRVIEGDFLSMAPEPIYDRIIMNPPFSGGADIKHVAHAAKFLKPDGRLLAITSPNWTFANNRAAQDFRSFVEESEGEVQEVAAGAFKESGTNVATRIIALDAENFPWNREVQESVSRERVRG